MKTNILLLSFLALMTSACSYTAPKAQCIENNASCFEQQCIKNDTESCNRLGVLYRLGYGVEKDTKKAMSYFQKTCDIKNGVGCWLLGGMYEGVEKDINKAKMHYEQACDLENGDGCNALGNLYHYADNETKDEKKAKEYYIKATTYLQKKCDVHKDGDSCWKAANMHLLGQGVEQDYKKAAQYYEKSCALPKKYKFFDNGCYELGDLYYKGQGVKQDFVKAKEYYKKGCDFGTKHNSEYACSMYKELENAK